MAPHPSRSLTMPDGSHLLLDCRGARVLELRAPGDETNFFWTSGSDQSSWNIGGDRTWISPEVDVFVPNFPDTSVFGVPQQVDPGAYQFAEDSLLRGRCTLTLSRSRSVAEIEIVKSWTPAPDPLDARHVRYAGYTQKTELGGPSADALAVWNIVQVPYGGEVILPVHGVAVPQMYFGAIPDEDILSSPGRIRYLARHSGLAKFGIRPAETTGRIGYLWPSDDAMNLVVRNVTVDPAVIYGDVPWSDPTYMNRPACPIQICAVNADIGVYVELEHHAPPGKADVAQLWAYRGAPAAVHEIAEHLLGARAQ